MRRVAHNSRKSGKRSRKNQQGVALVTTLLLLLLMTGMTVAMVMSVNSDMLINGYYRNSRGSFYAADSGLNIARREIANQLLNASAATVSGTTAPISLTAYQDVTTYIQNTYGAGYQGFNAASGAQASSWPSKFKIDSVSIQFNPTTDCVVIGGGGTCAAPTGGVTGYKYTYHYALTAKGQSRGNEEATVTDQGDLVLQANMTASGPTQTSFAAWGMFIDQSALCGNPYVPGTISGPVFTNGAWTFGTGSYVFTDDVGSANAKAGFDFGSNCYSAADRKYTSHGTTIAPTFQGKFNLGAPAVPLPDNDYNQIRAVLDGKGDNTANPTSTEKAAALRKFDGSAWSTGASSGVYMSYDSSTNTMKGGGIYVEGNASVVLQTTGTAQQYVITQGGTTTTITVDPIANQTTMKQGSVTKTISGVPQQIDPSTNNPVRDATLLYVNGDISSIKGPNSGPAIQSGTTNGGVDYGAAVTVVAKGDIYVTGDLKYKDRPVTISQNEIAGTPADTLYPGKDSGQVLGLFTNKGDIIMQSPCNGCDMEVDASLATISNGGTGGMKIGCKAAPSCSGNYLDTLTIVGGRINNAAYSTSMLNTRNVYFDRRFSQGGFSPPWFPSTTVTQPNTFQPNWNAPAFSRVRWLNQTTYF